MISPRDIGARVALQPPSTISLTGGNSLPSVGDLMRVAAFIAALITGSIKGANFGKATADSQFPQPIPGTNGGRLFRMAVDVRF
jgi:hypothetical protein